MLSHDVCPCDPSTNTTVQVMEVMEMRALTASSAIISLRVGEKTRLLTSSEIRTVMIKLPRLKYSVVMRNHSAESED